MPCQRWKTKSEIDWYASYNCHLSRAKAPMHTTEESDQLVAINT